MAEHPKPAPADWHHAFAALPLETPPASGWERIAPRLAKPPRRARRVLPWAIAAATACLAALPVLMLVRTPPPPAAIPGAASPAPLHGPTADARGDAAAAPSPTRPDSARADTLQAPATAAAALPSGAASDAATSTATAPTGGQADRERLYAESARLEALLAHLSGTESGDGAQLALTASLRAQVAGIDEALSTIGLDENQRIDLWRQRVDALGQLAAVAADQRWNALYGTTTDYALVQVY